MPKVINVDFRKAPPAQGGGGSDRIPPGDYVLRVANVDSRKASTGKPMVVVRMRVARGEQESKRIQDQFVFPESAEDSLFGVQRFHAFLQCLGLQPPTDRAFKFDLESLMGKLVVAEIADGELPAQANRPARTVSQIAEYKMPKAAAATPNGATPQAKQEASPAAEEEDDDDAVFGGDSPADSADDAEDISAEVTVADDDEDFPFN